MQKVPFFVDQSPSILQVHFCVMRMMYVLNLCDFRDDFTIWSYHALDECARCLFALNVYLIDVWI